MERSKVPLELLLTKTYKHGWTALHYAAHNGHAEACRALMTAAAQSPEPLGLNFKQPLGATLSS